MVQRQAGEDAARRFARGLGRRRQAGIAIARLAVVGRSKQLFKPVESYLLTGDARPIDFVRRWFGNEDGSEGGQGLHEVSPSANVGRTLRVRIFRTRSVRPTLARKRTREP